jgi:hypothetical protein
MIFGAYKQNGSVRALLVVIYQIYQMMIWGKEESHITLYVLGESLL